METFNRISIKKVLLSFSHFKSKASLQYWLHRSSKIAAYSNRNNSPETICTVYNKEFFPGADSRVQRNCDHKNQFCMCEK